jgi:FkbM family methyltransferase
MLQTLKHRLPEPLLAAARQLRARSRHLLSWQGRSLSYELSSGLSVELTSASDWAVYNEVFVEGEYDRAIRSVAGSSTEAPLALDLGANVGFFALRFADIWLRTRGSAPFHLLSVEGSPRTYAQLARNTDQPLLRGRCAARHGMIGRRRGYASISTSVRSGLNSMYTRQSFSRARVPFVDLDALVPPDGPIALVKCDIEGAEQAFIESYPGLLRRVQILVLEFHHELCDVRRSRELLDAAGLVHGRVLRAYGRCTVELFGRNHLADMPPSDLTGATYPW